MNDRTITDTESGDYRIKSDDYRANSAGDTRALSAVLAERRRQDGKWGGQNHHVSKWLLILGEEYGELCQAVLEGSVFDNGRRGEFTAEHIREEAVQVAAVALAIVESLDRVGPEGEYLEGETMNKHGYCPFCGEALTSVDSGFYDTRTGKRDTQGECRNPSCLSGKRNRCYAATGHSFSFFGGICKFCGASKYYEGQW